MALDEKAIFVSVLTLSDEGLREAYLQKTCLGQPELVQRIRKLLSAHAEPNGPLDRPPSALGAHLGAIAAETPAPILGPYELLERIGQGGWAKSGWLSSPNR
jgi:hypothetical protein